MTEITPTNILLNFFPESLIEHILFHTNLYATQIGKVYITTTSNEIFFFFLQSICLCLRKSFKL